MDVIPYESGSYYVFDRAYNHQKRLCRIQVYVAIIAFCLVAIVQHDLKLNRSTYEVLQILNLSMTDTTSLIELLNKTNFHDVKEQDSCSVLLLF